MNYLKQRLFVYQDSPESEPTALVNPVIVEASGAKEVAQEGCLSLGPASVHVDVARPGDLAVFRGAMFPGPTNPEAVISIVLQFTNGTITQVFHLPPPR